VDIKSTIEIIVACGIVVAPIALLIDRFAGDRGIGARAIQFLAVAMLIPTIVLLALEQRIEAATVGTLVGALTGYLLSGLGEFRSDSKRERPDDEPPPRR
jgi:hypothetical protein